jgi:hypothetical protein
MLYIILKLKLHTNQKYGAFTINLVQSKYLKVTNNLVKCVIFFIYSAYSDKIERTCYLSAETASLTAKR